MPKFKKGLPSPNPSGRPKGNTTAAKLRELLAEDLEDIIHTLKSLAKSGDVSAIKLILDKTVPSLRPQQESFIVNTIEGDTLADRGNLILDNVFRGDVSPDAGAVLLTALANQARLVESTELMARIEKLEAGGAGNG
ncbi:MAG: hypothetical protein QX199_15335 [Methylococcaceae bacterium]